MKRKLVLWGTNAQDEKVLVAIELLAEENQIKIHSIPETLATEEVHKAMMDQWRVGAEYALPEGIESVTRDLSISESMLPEDIKVENTSLIQRAQTEWHFVVLSSKLNATYRSELEDFKEKVEKLTEYDAAVWESLKGFWSKVQEQVKEKNLFWDHANELKNGTNALFSKMKELRAVLDEEFRSQSKKYADTFSEALGEIEEKIKENVNINGLFNDLKDLQRKYRDTKFTREDRNAIWERLDKAFKQVKEKKYGKENVPGNSPLDRVKRRLAGLVKAIEKMERSIKRDDEELKFQNRRAERTEGQLELQIRQAKIKMLDQRANSKKEKLADMRKTEGELNRKIEKLSAQQQRREKKEASSSTPPAAQSPSKDSKAEAQPESKTQEAPTQQTKAESEAPEATDKQGIAEAISSTLGESLTDVVDTVKAVAEVVGEKVSETIEETKEELEAEKKSEEE
ncbi:MAG: hypothetical protein HKN16_01895 [Saprospiraceae bacterium]|nr:hypothetical protein [Saprospiraceae bacterium]